MKVSDIKKLRFQSLPLEIQLNIKNNGKPVPDLDFRQVQKKCKGRGEFTRRFNRKVYENTDWICGCEEDNSLYCFVCLLFGGDDSWTKTGITDLKHLIYKMNKHENSVRHKTNLISFQLLGKTNSVVPSSSDSIRQHNERVERNRQILSKMIEVLKLCGRCNLPLSSGGDQHLDSPKRNIFSELMEYTKKLDLTFNNHISEDRIFKENSEMIQDELLRCMLDVYRRQIIKEVNQSSFLSIMVDDVSDASDKTLIALVLRYELGGELHERFWGFSEVLNTNAASQYIYENLDIILGDNSDKLIAQTHDASLLLRGLNVQIKEGYRRCHYVYCYAHPLHALVEQAASIVPAVRIFFANLKGIAAFFTSSPDRRAALEYTCDEKVPGWDFHSNLLQTFISYREAMMACFGNIQEGIPKIYNSETIALATGYAEYLEKPSFWFWVNFFYSIMGHVDILNNRTLCFPSDPGGIQAAVDEFVKAITAIKNELPPTVKIEAGCSEESNQRKRPRLSDENLHLAAGEVCEVIMTEIKERFAFVNHLFGEKIFEYDPNSVLRREGPPIRDVDTFCNAFPIVDKSSLLSELLIFYSRQEIIGRNLDVCLKILDFITRYQLEKAFKEVTKALKIIVTIPMTTSDPQRSFPTLKLIKSCLKNIKSENNLCALAMLFAEGEMIGKIPDLNNVVMEKFISDENRKRHFSYLKI